MTNLITGGSPEDGPVVQAFGTIAPARLGLPDDVRLHSVAGLNRLLAHTLAIRDIYKKAQDRKSVV